MTKGLDLQWKILIGILGGILIGVWLNQTVGPDVQEGWPWTLGILLKYGGEIFLRLLRMLIVPLVAASVFSAVVNLGQVGELGKVGIHTLLYYFATTALAVLTGLILVNWIHPGHGIDPESLRHLGIEFSVPEAVSIQGVGDRNAVFIILETLIEMIPINPFEALAKADVLQIIFFSVFFGIIAGKLGKKTESVRVLVEALDLIVAKSIEWVMLIAPYCIFLLVTDSFMDLGLPVLQVLAKYAFTVFFGLCIHAFVTLPLLVWLIGGYNPFKLCKAVSTALMTAWSTASSAATLPLTMDCVHRKAGVPSKISDFVLPLGATVNMDGTALYESVAVIFIAELMGIQLDFSMQIVVFITATLAAIGAAAVPGAGLVTMGIVLTAVGLPLDGIGLILAIDRLLDQFRTTVNVWGDTTAAVVVARLDQGSPQRR